MYSLKYKVTTSTCDSEGRLKLYSALQMMQDCSEMWIDSEPQVKEYFEQQNMAQLLATRQMEIIRVPEYKEELTVTTSVYGMKPMFGFRNTFIYDAEGQPCYKTWSMGSFVDMATGKLKRVDDKTIQSMSLEQQVRMAMELLPDDFKVSGLRVEYRVAAKLGDSLVPTLYRVDGGIVVALAVGDDVSAIVEFT